ncbi:MAG: lysylphosphatidylglycerol synthase transmembrane domain-containing protein [Dysgonomonas sp.]
MDNNQQEPVKQAEEILEKTSKSSLLKKILSIAIPLGLGILILWFLYRDTDFEQMWSIIKDANYGILAFSLLFGLLGNTIRGYRWKTIITPLGYDPKPSNLIFAVYGNYAVNFALPRAGEIWRCGVVSKDEKIPFVKLFGTVIIDRLLDTLTVLLISILAFFLNMEFFLQYLKQNQELFDKVLSYVTSPLPYIAVVVFVGAIVLIFKVFKNNAIIIKIKDFFIGIGKDMKAIWKMKQKKRLFLYSFLIWLSYFLYFYITFFAFDFTKDLGFAAGLFVFAISSISMGVPSNGGLGPWQATVFFGLCAFMVDSEQAKAFATAVFTVQSVWVILCGLFGIFALAVKNRGK